MKKNNLIILISIVLNFVVFNNQINAQYSKEINYSNAKEDLKEFLAIQALLSENRMNELINFFDENNYYSVPGLETPTYSKIKIDSKSTEIHSMIQIESGKFPDAYVDNSLSIYFNIKPNEDSPILYPNEKNALLIQQYIRNEMESGLPYSIFTQMNLEELGLEKIDRYTVRDINKDKYGKLNVFKASNFINTPGYDDEVTFYGPGKTSWTVVMFDKPVPLNNDGAYLCKITIASGTPDPQKNITPFNLKFFMGLKNFNDRIWLDN